jgi:mannose/fructose/N-acetylgalactosamine-specific phosphotransferase system component IIC
MVIMGIDVVVGTSMSAVADDGPTIRAAAVPVAAAVQMADLRLNRTCGCCCCDQAWIRVDAIEIEKRKQKRVVVVMAIMLVVLRRLERRYSEWPVMVVMVVMVEGRWTTDGWVAIFRNVDFSELP